MKRTMKEQWSCIKVSSRVKKHHFSKFAIFRWSNRAHQELSCKKKFQEKMFFLCRLTECKSFFYANYFNWSLTSPVILDTRAAVEPSQSCNLTEIVVYEYSAHCFSLEFESECLQRRKKSLSVFVLDSTKEDDKIVLRPKEWASKLAESDKGSY